jgi:hypothetical protein
MLEYFTAIGIHILRPFGMLYVLLVYFVVISLFLPVLVSCAKKYASGNPGRVPLMVTGSALMVQTLSGD